MSKPYVRPMPKTWWLKRWPYFLFMLRELTAVFVGAYAILLLVMLYKFGQGEAAFNNFLDMLKHPVSIALHAVALLAALYHTITWFNLTPQALVVQIGETRVPGVLIAGIHYVAWIAVSGLIAWRIVLYSQ